MSTNKVNTNTEETKIFDAARVQLKGSKVVTRLIEPIPPELPYLLAQDPAPKRTRELLDRVFVFRDSNQGIAYRDLVNRVRADGTEARRAENLSLEELKKAQELLAPYSELDPEKSRSLEITLSSELVGVPGVEASFKANIPAWLKIWWNDKVSFGRLRKTLRRMWMAADSYNDL